MRKTILATVVAAAALWPAAPAMANHDPCVPSDMFCVQIACPSPQYGAGYVYLDSRGLPHVDFTDCFAT